MRPKKDIEVPTRPQTITNRSSRKQTIHPRPVMMLLKTEILHGQSGYKNGSQSPRICRREKEGRFKPSLRRACITYVNTRI